MISERTKALLQASATLYAGMLSSPNLDTAKFGEDPEGLAAVCVTRAYALLAEIERRERANAPKSTNYCTCEVIGDNHLCPTHGG